MKNKMLMLTGLAVALFTAQAAYAGGDEASRRIGWENYDYFYHMNEGKPSSGQAVMRNPAYEFNSRPEQRMAQRNHDYFQRIGYKGGDVKPFNYYTDVSQYPFPGSVLSAERGGYVFSSARKR